jgi:hypothetical protein
MKITKSQLRQIIKEEVATLEEGLEQITPENIELLFDVMKKMATEPAIVAALGAGGMVAAIDKIKQKVAPVAPTAIGITEPEEPTKTSGL